MKSNEDTPDNEFDEVEQPSTIPTVGAAKTNDPADGDAATTPTANQSWDPTSDDSVAPRVLQQSTDDQGKTDGKKERGAQDFDAEAAEDDSFDMLNPEPPSPFDTTRCSGYGEDRGRCPNYATARATWGVFDDQIRQPLCPLCFAEYRAEREQWRSEQFDGEQEQ